MITMRNYRILPGYALLEAPALQPSNPKPLVLNSEPLPKSLNLVARSPNVIPSPASATGGVGGAWSCLVISAHLYTLPCVLHNSLNSTNLYIIWRVPSLALLTYCFFYIILVINPQTVSHGPSACNHKQVKHIPLHNPISP